jgi:pyridoxamine 5'-phosphate oxidase
MNGPGPLIHDPIARFHAEFERARSVEPNDVTAVALATATPAGVPSLRYVLLKSADARGFVFYTNRESRKGRELAQNAHAALAFLWPTVYVQVRVEGTVEQVDDAESDAYFASRPRGSQLGAWASQQSRLLSAREVLAAAVDDFDRRFPEGSAVPRPPYWGGYRLVPTRVEFWQGRESRLHERDVYLREGDGWRLQSLYP